MPSPYRSPVRARYANARSPVARATKLAVRRSFSNMARMVKNGKYVHAGLLYNAANMSHIHNTALRRQQIAEAKKRRLRVFKKVRYPKVLKLAARRSRAAHKKGKYFMGKRVNYT